MNETFVYAPKGTKESQRWWICLFADRAVSWPSSSATPTERWVVCFWVWTLTAAISRLNVWKVIPVIQTSHIHAECLPQITWSIINDFGSGGAVNECVTFLHFSLWKGRMRGNDKILIDFRSTESSFLQSVDWILLLLWGAKSITHRQMRVLDLFKKK